MYIVYPKQMERFETKPYSRKFPIVLYDLREVDSIREDNAELKQIELESINTAPRVESNSKVTELPILQEDENSISLETAGGLRLADDPTPSNLEPVVVAVDEKDINNEGGFSVSLLVANTESVTIPSPASSSIPMKMNVDVMVMTILKSCNIIPSSHYVSSSGECSVTFSCPSSVSEHVLGLLENMGLDCWFGSVYVTSCELYKSSEMTQESSLRDGVASRLILVEEMINLIDDGATCTFDYLLLLISAGFMAAVGLGSNSSVVTVASMLVSPLMGPILGIAFAAVVHDAALLRKSLRSEIVGILVCFLCGIVVGLVCTPLGLLHRGNIWPGWPTDEMVNRGDPFNLIVGFFVALPSGVGVALAISGRNTSSLVGVAISASLLPPCVNAGMLWAYAFLAPLIGKIPEGFTAKELAVLGVISFCLCLVNIV